MNIVIVSIEEPVYLYEFWKHILGELRSQVTGIYVFNPLAKGWKSSVYEAFYNSLLVLYLYQPADVLKVIKDLSLSMLRRKKPFFSLYSLADDCKIPISSINSVNSDAFVRELRQISPDLILAQIPERIGKEALGVPKTGWINKHFGLLPDYRGAAPFLWAYWNQDPHIGATVHFMNERYDEGDILGQEIEALKENDTLSSVLKRLNWSAANLMIECVSKLPKKHPQDANSGRYFPKPTMRQLIKHLLCEYKYRFNRMKTRSGK